MLGILINAEETPRPPSVKPTQTDEIEPFSVAYATVVNRAAKVVENINVDPSIVRAKPNRPQDGCDAFFLAVNRRYLAFRAPDLFKFRFGWGVDCLLYTSPSPRD